MEKSTSIVNLAKSLSTFHSIMGKVSKDSVNPFFKSKYAGLPNILEAIQEPLKESGIVFTQFPSDEGLCTIIVDVKSGEYMQSCYKILPVKNDPQAQGSAITYARRYALVSIFGLNVDDDDDGNKASEKPWLNKGSKEWDGAVQFVKGGGSIDKIELKYQISKENKAELIKS